MIEPFDSPYRVSFDRDFSVADAPTTVGKTRKKEYRKQLDSLVNEIVDQQRRLYATNQHSVLLIFQAMDAAGKDSTIRAVMSGIDPTGCQVYSFKRPSSRELDHDFLWRSARFLPERGRIGVFNRSYYEEVLVVRVHPEILDHQRLPWRPSGQRIWKQRFESIRDHEKHLARNGTVIIKFWLNVSPDEQRRRFLSRIDEPAKNWKFEMGDLKPRSMWDEYMHAYQDALRATSRPHAPWYAIPADDKPTMRLTVAKIVLGTLQNMNLEYPVISDAQRDLLKDARKQLAKK